MTWVIGYIYEGFLVWIIPSTYKSHGSVLWAYITDFSIVTLLTVSFHVHICLYSRYTFHVHMYLLCTPFGFIYALAGLRLITLDSHVQILEPGSWQLGCSWSERAADSPVVIRVQQKLRHRYSSSSQLFSCLALLLLVTISQLLLCISLHVLYFYIFWWYNIPVILYHSL